MEIIINSTDSRTLLNSTEKTDMTRKNTITTLKCKFSISNFFFSKIFLKICHFAITSGEIKI